MKKGIRIFGAMTICVLMLGLNLSGDVIAQNDPPLRQLRAFSVGVVSVEEPFTATSGEEFSGQFTLPPGTMLETINVQDLDVDLIRRLSPEREVSLLEPGDIVRVLVEGSDSFEGEVINPEGWSFGNSPLCIQLSSMDNPFCLSGEEVMGLQIIKTAQGEPFEGRMEEEERPLTVEVEGIAKSNTPSISYLVRGALNWKPVYHLELSTGDFTAFAFSDNLFDFPETNITFVMGSPHLVRYGNIASGAMYQSQDSVSPPESPTILGELWEYRYEGLIDLREGESIQLPLFDASLELEEVYYWDGGEVLLKHKFENNLDRPLASGRVVCYENGLWVGEDMLDWAAVGEKSDFVSQYALDIEVKETIVQTQDSFDKRVVEKEVVVRNHKENQISIEIVRYLPSRANLISANPAPVQEGGKLTWTNSLEPGESQKMTYQYEVILKGTH